MDEQQPVTCKFYNDGRCRFGAQCRNLHEGEVHVMKKSKPKRVKDKIADDHETEIRKLPSMKTARDVIQRIQWDDDMPSQYFSVGYLDRFVGVVEQPFDLFDWTSDLASVDPQNVLAIPQHRIQFFKYRGKKVWDKNDRLDLIFGSTSDSTKDVKNLLHSIDEELLFTEEILSVETEVLNSSDISDRPTHFLAVRINDEKLVAALDNVVMELAASNSCGGKIDSSLYHCTLALLSLDSTEKIAHCAQLLKSIGHSAFSDPPMSLKFEGLSTFRDRVLFSGVTFNTPLNSTVISLINFLKQNAVQVLDRPNEFHVSLVKGWKNVCNLDANKVKQFNEQVLGNQQIDFIHLCTLHESPDADGFYKVVASVELTASTTQHV